MSQTQLILYVVRGTANSSNAEQNLYSAMARLQGPSPELLVVDLAEDPQRAVADGILVTPALSCRRGNQREIIIGSLGDADLIERKLVQWCHP